MNRDRVVKGVEDFFKSVEIHGMTGLVTCSCGMLRTRDGRLPKIEVAYAPLQNWLDLTHIRIDNLPLRRVPYLDQLIPQERTALRHYFEGVLEKEVANTPTNSLHPNAFHINNPNVTTSSVDEAILRIGYVLSLYKIL